MTVFVSAGQEESGNPAQTMIARQDVGQDGGVSVPDMGRGVDIINRRRDIEFIVFHQ